MGKSDAVHKFVPLKFEPRKFVPLKVATVAVKPAEITLRRGEKK